MSDYFGALMRSSGLAIGGPAPAMTHVEPGVVEVDVERLPTAPPQRAVQAASPPKHAMAPIPVAHAEDQSAPSSPPATDTGGRGVQTGSSVIERAPRHGAVETTAGSPAARPVEVARPAAGQPLVRAAMQWVAADTQHAHSVPQVVQPRVLTSPARDAETSSVGAPQMFREGVIEGHTQAPSATPATSTTPDLAAREPFASRPLPTRSVHLTSGTPSISIAPLARDEVVEVSIGAIHVRVDAPVAQTVTRPAATPPLPHPHAATASVPRSALSRRALRRI